MAAVGPALALGLLLAACAQDPELPRLAPEDVVLAFGDSLTYGTGVPAEESYPAVLAERIGRPVVRAGVPGETTAEALRRLPGALDTHQPRLLLLMTGGNDFLRKVPREDTEAHLRAMLALARASGVAVLLVGVPVPRLFAGPPAFYAVLAEEHGVPYEGEVLRRVLYDNRAKSDPIHPNALGYRRIAEALAATRCESRAAAGSRQGAPAASVVASRVRMTRGGHRWTTCRGWAIVWWTRAAGHVARCGVASPSRSGSL
jgi:lysophospholipase L1-like esterase